MASKNQVSLLGRLGKDPEVRTFQSGDSITSFSLATTETWKDKQTGEKKESTQWHNCVASARLGEVIAQYTRKGSLVDLDGKLVYRKYTDKDKVERTVAEIRVIDIRFLDRREESQGSAPAPQSRAPASRPRPVTRGNTALAPAESWDAGDDDIPY